MRSISPPQASAGRGEFFFSRLMFLEGNLILLTILSGKDIYIYIWILSGVVSHNEAMQLASSDGHFRHPPRLLRFEGVVDYE